MRRKGFTLVELAIVLVIIGIILGAILKGQELINNARAKRVQNDMRGIEALLWTFYDRYGRFPGDCDRNGFIDATTYNYAGGGGLDNNPDHQFCPTNNNPNYDRDMPWAELKAASLLPLTSSNLELSKNVLNGRFWIGRAYVHLGTHYYYGNAIAIADIPCYVAKMIDTSIDGKVDAGSGRIRELTGATSAQPTNGSPWSCNTDSDNVDLVYFFDKLPAP